MSVSLGLITYSTAGSANAEGTLPLVTFEYDRWYLVRAGDCDPLVTVVGSGLGRLFWLLGFRRTSLINF